ncbi:MAG: SAM-dependent DNA methyltransferase [Kiritimatiellae bacterium]|nr:SAM-dependent DNA methyltransferase [Kiritimatiellia bacterium]
MRTPLDKNLRSALERTTLAARDVAETAAREVFTQLGVTDAKAPEWLDKDQASFRRALRAHARALGGERAADGSQKVAALVEEVAYEQWNRMVFARFLAENGLLVYDGVAVTLAECAALAEEMNFPSAWDVAADCAAKMLPNVFRTDSLSFKVKFAPDKVKKLESLVESLATETFQASDSLGWIYQFWQTRKKAAVNASEVKIGADELAPVTQLFTEPYMVAFLLDNSLGAWYATKKLKGRLFSTEAEARAAVATKDIPLKYLRLVPVKGLGQDLQDSQDLKSNPDNPVNPVEKTPCEWRPASGSFEKWPENLADFSMLDPCCGSGHFAVATLLMLVPMRMELEGLDARTAVDKVLSENVHALELDRRCVEIAAFAVALEAWRYPNAGGYRPLPRLNIACVGIAPSGKRDKWLRLARMAAGGPPSSAADIGRVRSPSAPPEPTLYEENLVRSMGALWDCFQQAPILGSLISPDLVGNDLWHQTDYNTLAEVLAEHLDKTTDEEKEASIAAQGIIQAMQLLGRKYTLVATNVPYLGKSKMDGKLYAFCSSKYPLSKDDLATAFLERCLKIVETEGLVTAVLPQNWMFIKSYSKFRKHILTIKQILFLAQLNEGAFESPSAAGGFAVLIGLSNTSNMKGKFYGLDCTKEKTPDYKKNILREGHPIFVSQYNCSTSPDARISLVVFDAGKYLSDYCKAFQGIKTGDDCRIKQNFWEGSFPDVLWKLSEGSLSVASKLGYSYRIFWNKAGECIARLQGVAAFSRNGVSITTVRNLVPFYHTRNAFTSELSAVVPYESSHLTPVLEYLWSKEYPAAVRAIDQKIAVTNATLVKVPFDLERWQKVAAEKYPNGLPEPFTDDPTQWIFHGHPCGSVVWDEETKRLKIGADRVDSTVLHVAVARLLGYRWPSELDEKMELAAEMREVMARNVALEQFADNDGIVCIPALNGEESAASRLMALLKEAYGESWSAKKLEALLESVGAGGKTLEEWLRKDFFLQHSKLFGSRPFVWQIWDGLRDGFSVLVNYHKLDRKGLETLIYSYLGDWITRQSNDVKSGVEGADERLDRANELKAKLEKILEGEAPYDIFVRWKPLKDQPVGWNPDLNDGVRLNIRPFFEAGVLREKAQKLNIKWGKDRGKDVPSAPWYAVFHGDRINDHHLSLAEKQAANEES